MPATDKSHYAIDSRAVERLRHAFGPVAKLSGSPDYCRTAMKESQAVAAFFAECNRDHWRPRHGFSYKSWRKVAAIVFFGTKPDCEQVRIFVYGCTLKNARLMSDFRAYRESIETVIDYAGQLSTKAAVQKSDGVAFLAGAARPARVARLDENSQSEESQSDEELRWQPGCERPNQCERPALPVHSGLPAPPPAALASSALSRSHSHYGCYRDLLPLIK